MLEVRLKINPDHAEERKVVGAVKKIMATTVENGAAENKGSGINNRRKIPKIKMNEPGVWVFSFFSSSPENFQGLRNSGIRIHVL